MPSDLIQSRYVYTVCILSFCVLVYSSLRKNGPLSNLFATKSERLAEEGFHYFLGSDELNMLTAHLFPRGKQYYLNYTAYDSYSVREIGKTQPSAYWQRFSMDVLEQATNPIPQYGLIMVDAVMVITGKHLQVRHAHLRKVLERQGIRAFNIEYRWNWSKENCTDSVNSQRIKLKYPYTTGDHSTDLGCANVMEHIDAWHAVANRNLSFALILEDDVVFVPFLKEKFNRLVSEAVKLKLIKVGRNRDNCSTFETSKNMTLAELLKDPILTEGVFHFGKCQNVPTPGLDPDSMLEIPKFTSHRGYDFGRCAHMYGMTHCAAKMLLRGLQTFPMRYQRSDWLINHIIASSPNLINWWTDPPLAYQTSEIEITGELDPLLKQRTYDPDRKQPIP